MTEGTASEIRQRVEKTRTLSLVLSGDVEGKLLCDACPAVHSAASIDGTWHLEVTDPHAAVSQIVSFAEKQGVRILEIRTAAVSLEDAFMTIVEDKVAERGGRT